MPGPTERSIPPVNGQPLMSPAGLLGDASEPLPERAVLVYDDSYVPRRGRRRKPAPFRRVALHREASIPVAIVAAVGPGAPTVAVTVEFLHHLGVRSLISVGLAGALDNNTHPGEVRAVAGAVSDEGTSAKYGSHLLPNLSLSHGLGEELNRETNTSPVTAVSTDTPLVHTARDLALFRESAQVMEMELAALFSVANHLKVAAAALVVISDQYSWDSNSQDSQDSQDSRDSWSLGDPAKTRPAIDRAIDVAARVLIRFDHQDRPKT